MPDHTPLYELIQEVFNAGALFEFDTARAIKKGEELPYAAPRIVPLAKKVEQYVDRLVQEGRRV